MKFLFLFLPVLLIILVIFLNIMKNSCSNCIHCIILYVNLRKNINILNRFSCLNKDEESCFSLNYNSDMTLLHQTNLINGKDGRI